MKGGRLATPSRALTDLAMQNDHCRSWAGLQDLSSWPYPRWALTPGCSFLKSRWLAWPPPGSMTWSLFGHTNHLWKDLKQSYCPRCPCQRRKKLILITIKIFANGHGIEQSIPASDGSARFFGVTAVLWSTSVRFVHRTCSPGAIGA
jgi:hypothetical protein